MQGEFSVCRAGSACAGRVQRVQGGFSVCDHANDEGDKGGRRAKDAPGKAGGQSHLVIDLDVGRRRLGDAADHELRRERPRLRRVVPDGADTDARFLDNLATDRFLLARAGGGM